MSRGHDSPTLSPALYVVRSLSLRRASASACPRSAPSPRRTPRSLAPRAFGAPGRQTSKHNDCRLMIKGIVLALGGRRLGAPRRMAPRVPWIPPGGHRSEARAPITKATAATLRNPTLSKVPSNESRGWSARRTKKSSICKRSTQSVRILEVAEKTRRL